MSKQSFSHPLYGSSLSNLVRLFWLNGGVTWKYFPRSVTALASAAGRLPFSLLESLWYGRKLKNLKLQPPIFIIGHWRSGTTHLCNILSQSPVFGFVTPVASGIPHDLLVMGKLFRPWLERSIPPDRLIDRVPVRVDSPQEDEFALANMVTTSFLHGIYFPGKLMQNFQKGVFPELCNEMELRRWKNAVVKYLKKIYLDQGGRPLLIKNPGHTARVALLRELFPGAKFLHIYRNPYDVYPSMKNYFNKLLPVLALQDYGEADITKVILDTYPRMMDRVIADLKALPHQNYLEVRYEDLENQPMEQIENIYNHLGFAGFDQAKPLFESYLSGIRGYKKNQYLRDPAEVELVSSHWKSIIDHYGY